MPAAIAPIVVGGGLGVALGVVTVTEVLISAAIGGAMSLIAERDARSALRRARDNGTKVNIRNNVEAIPILYGEVRRANGAVVFARTSRRAPAYDWGNEDRLNLVIVWSEGPIEGFVEHYLDEWPSTSSRYGLRAGQVDGVYVRVSSHLGTDDQEADAALLAIAAYEPDIGGGPPTDGDRRLHEWLGIPLPPTIPARWTSAHRLLGTAYSYVGLLFEPSGSNGIWAGGVPVVTAHVRGIRPTHPVTGEPTTLGSPPWALYDYLTSSRYGCGVGTDEIDIDSFDQAAAYCDEYVIPPSASDSPRRRYSCDGILSPDEPRLDNIRRILSSCRGMLVYSAGRFKIVLDKPEAPSGFELNETNLVGKWSIALDSHGDRYNRVRAEFVNSAKRDKPDFIVVDSPDYRAADGGQVLQLDLQLPMTTSAAMARDLAELALRSSRYGAVVVVRATLAALRCEIGDVVSVTHEIPGWTAKPFRVMRMQMTSAEEIELTLREYNDDAYDITSEPDDEEPIGSGLQSPDLMDPVTSLTATPGRHVNDDGVSERYMDLAWDAYGERFFVAGFDIEWKRTADAATAWQGVAVNSPQLESYRLWNIEHNVEYTFRVRPFNSLRIAGDWVTVTATNDIVGGPLQPIVSVTATQTAAGVGTIAWTPPADARVTEVEVWRSIGPDFFEATTAPVLLATLSIDAGSYAVNHPGFTMYYWLRAKGGGRTSNNYTPSEYGAGVVITG